MIQKRIFFTGGTGKAGKHVIPYLLEQGHKVMNVDLMLLDYPCVNNLIADITDSGQMFNAMSSYMNLEELETGNGVQPFDAIVHFATVPRILIKPDNETFRVNTIGTYIIAQKAKVVIVVLTTSANPDDIKRAKEIPDVTGFETKPLTKELLTEILQQYY